MSQRMLVEAAPRVLVATSRVMSTTSTVLTGAGRALLIDPAWMPDELDGLDAELTDRGLAVIGGFATHAHHDHLLWHPGFGDAPRWASDRTAALAGDEREALVAALGPEFPAALVDLMGRVTGCGDAVPDESLPPGVETTLVVHDGHASGHTAIWLPGPRVLIAGDMLSDIELPLPFDPDDLPAYLDALGAIAPFAARASVVIPGHGTVGGDALARLDADRRYLDDLLRTGTSDDPRIDHLGMAEEHAHVRRMAAGYGGSTAVSLRTAVPGDIDGMMEVQRRSPGRPASDAFRRRTAAVLEDDASHVVVAIAEGDIVGWAMTAFFDAADGAAPAGHYLMGVTVVPGFRRRGVGGALIRARLDWIAARADAAWFFTNARNSASIALHERFGFTEIARGPRFRNVPFDGGAGVLFSVRLRS